MSPAALGFSARQFLGWSPTRSPKGRHTAARQRVKAARQSLGWSPAIVGLLARRDGRPAEGDQQNKLAPPNPRAVLQSHHALR